MSEGNGTAYPEFPVVEGVRFALIPGYPGYAAGDDGTVWGCRNGAGGWNSFKPRPPFRQWRKLLPCLLHGYSVVNVRRADGNWRVTKISRLVLYAFVGPCPPGHECRHFPSNDRTNNKLTNVRWGTPSENTHDQVKDGTHYFSKQKGKRIGSAARSLNSTTPLAV